MSSITFYIFFILFLAFVLLAINLLLAPNNPYQEKDSVFECGFHSFLGQNRTQFSISFFVFALLFLLFDLEILLVYPYVVSAYTNGIYGLVIMLVFFLVLTLGFAFELGKKALNIDTRQSSPNFFTKKKFAGRSPANTAGGGVDTIFNVRFTLKNLFTISPPSPSPTSKRNYSTTPPAFLSAFAAKFFLACDNWLLSIPLRGIGKNKGMFMVIVSLCLLAGLHQEIAQLFFYLSELFNLA